MTETEVEAPAVEAPEYPPEKVHLPVAIGDRVVVLKTVYEADARFVGETVKVVNAHRQHTSEDHYITVENTGGHQFYVKNWVHVWVVNQSKPLEALPLPNVGDEVTILRAMCCPAANGMRGVVHDASADAVTVVVSKPDGTTETHVASFTDAQVHKGIHPQDYVENNPPMKDGDTVYVLRAESGNQYDFSLGTVVYTRSWSGEYRDYLMVRMANHQDAWVSTWLRPEDVPTTMPAVGVNEPITILDVFGSTNESYIGTTGEVYDRIHNLGVRVIQDSDYRRVRQWAIGGQANRESNHRQAIPKNTRVRVLSVKSPDRKSMVGKMGVTTADVDGKREACIVEVEGERVLVTEWTPVDKSGAPSNPRFLSMMTDEQVEALIQEVYDVADRLADKESWCNEYDQVMLTKIGREKGTIRLTQKWRVEVAVYGKHKGRKPSDENPITLEWSIITFRTKGNASGPSAELIRKFLDEHKKYEGCSYDLRNNWKES